MALERTCLSPGTPSSAALRQVDGWCPCAVLPLCVTVQFNVLGPAYPVLAVVGENVMLRCHLSPEKNAEGYGGAAVVSVAVSLRCSCTRAGGREQTSRWSNTGKNNFVSEAISEGVGADHTQRHRLTASTAVIFQKGRSYDEAIVHTGGDSACFHFVRLLFHSTCWVLTWSSVWVLMWPLLYGCTFLVSGVSLLSIFIRTPWVYQGPP